MARLTRREMLRLSGTLVAGGLLAGCAPAATEAPTEAPTEPPTEAPPDATEAPPAAAPIEGHVVVMRSGDSYSEEMMQALLDEYPGITIEPLDMDTTRFFAMYAAGTPPDLVRTQAPAIPQYLARNMLYDLTPYFETSDLLHLDDLAAANNYYRAYSPVEIGDGPIYGMCKDWSPDFTMFLYTQAFEDAGVDLPSDEQHLTYQEVADLARALKVMEGDRMLMFGYGYDSAWTDRMWMNMLAELGAGLYTEGFASINLTGSEDAMAVIRYYYDLASEDLAANPLNPSPSWIGDDFNRGILAICQYGFWFGGMAETDITTGKTIMIPTATWADVPRDPTMTATGYIMTAATQVPDAAWKAFEYYSGGQPAVDRATSGWGVPALISMVDLIPNETEFEQQKYAVLQQELALETTPLQFNPFLSEGAVVDSWTRFLEQALLGAITFEECVANVESEVNAAIQDGIDRIG